MAEITTGEQKAYEISRSRTKKQAARDRGVADAIAEAPLSVVEAARQRALGGVEKADAPAPQPKAAAPSVQRIKLQDGTVVPEQYYDLDAADQKRMVELIKERETKEKDDNAALTAVNTLLDLRVQDNAKLKAVEGQLSTLLGVVEAQQRQISGLSTQIEVGKSDALLEQQAEIAQMTVNLQAIGAEQEANHQRRMEEAKTQAIEHRGRMEASERVLGDMEGRLKSSGTLFQERSNAVVDQLAGAEGRQARLGVQLTELEGQADSLGTPITRQEVTALVTDSVTAEWKAQQPALVDAAVDEVRDQFPAGLGGQRVDSSRTRQLREDANRFQLEATS